MTSAAFLKRYGLLASILGGVVGLTFAAHAQVQNGTAVGTAAPEKAKGIDRGKMRLELLISLVENELKEATVLKTQLLNESARLEEERAAIAAKPTGRSSADQVRMNRIESRLEQIGEEMTAVNTKVPDVTAELDDLQRRLDEANGIVREPAAVETVNGTESTEPSASQWLDGNRQIQEALVYLGGYNALIDGDIGPRTREAISVYQERQGFPKTGSLSDEQRAALLRRAEAVRAEFGMTTTKDSSIGYRVSYPGALLSKVEASEDGGQRMTTDDGQGELLITTDDIQNDLTAVYEAAVEQYEVQYRRKRDDWFVVAGLSDQGRIIYDTARQTPDNGLVRARLSYPAAWRDRWSPFAVIMFNTFEILPSGES